MAKRVNIELVDDIDESPAEETVSFALDGKQYTIDVNAKHATELRRALAPYVGHATAVHNRPGRRGRRSSNGDATSASEIRAWARENGWKVPDRGRVSSDVREAYAAAH
ncbi:MAG: Lsr2 family protein [Actinomycetota bacterium]|nr:Lsr2 family protein [Actinomycetota bacterium]